MRKLLSLIIILFTGWGMYVFLGPQTESEPPEEEGGMIEEPSLQEEAAAASGELGWPLREGERREKKLAFGTYVTPDPETNPIDPPERFTGYHAGLDLEIFPEEENVDVAVYAACDGEVLGTGPIDGYGGVLTQSCRLGAGEVTVLYGHIDPNRFQYAKGDEIKRGDELGYLAPEKSAESGFTRKHLHLAVRKGVALEIPGYLKEVSLLGEYLDPLPLLEGGF